MFFSHVLRDVVQHEHVTAIVTLDIDAVIVKVPLVHELLFLLSNVGSVTFAFARPMPES